MRYNVLTKSIYIFLITNLLASGLNYNKNYFIQAEKLVETDPDLSLKYLDSIEKTTHLDVAQMARNIHARRAS